MYLPSHSSSHPRSHSPPRVVAATTATAAAAAAAAAHHSTNDVRRRLRVELHAQHHHHPYQQPYHQRVSLGDGRGSGAVSRYQQHYGGGEGGARKVAAVAAIQQELSKLDGPGVTAAGGLAATGPPPMTTSKAAGGSSSGSSSGSSGGSSGRGKPPSAAPSVVASSSSSSAAAAAAATAALPLTIGMGMLRTSSAGSLPTLLRAGKRQLPSSSSSSSASSGRRAGGGAHDGNAAAAMDVAASSKVHIPSHKKQELDDGGARRPPVATTASLLGAGLGVGIYAATASVSIAAAGPAAGGRRNRSCSDLSSVLFPQGQALRLAATTTIAGPAAKPTHNPTPAQQQQPAAPKLSRFAAGLTTTLQTLLAAPRAHAPPPPTAGRHCGAATAKGRKAARPLWTNQDSFLFVEWGEGDGGGAAADAQPPQGLVGMYAVMDGHGDVGHRVSQHCRERLPHVMAQAGYDPHKAYPLLQEELKASFGAELDSSGCTCVLALLHRPAAPGGPMRLTVANLGDSRCVLGRRRRRAVARAARPQAGMGLDGADSSSSGSSSSGSSGGSDEEEDEDDEMAEVMAAAGVPAVVAVALSEDQKPDRPDELQRIVAAGGRVGCRQYYVGCGAASHGPGHGRSASMPQFAVQLGPPRLWYPVPGGGQGEYTGLAMSRSLGDVAAHAAGGSCEPEVVTRAVKAGRDAFLVLATDGLWDVVGNQLAVELVEASRARAAAERRAWAPREAAEVLVKFARQRWEGLSPEMIDDITAVVVRLE